MKKKSAFSVIELIVVIAILAVLTALVLSAIQKIRASSQRATCQNNMKEIGWLINHFETAKGYLPTSGKGLIDTAIAYDIASTFMVLMPYTDNDKQFLSVDWWYYPYNYKYVRPQAKIQPNFLLCPSHPNRQPDPDGYGLSDYMPISYVDIDPLTGTQNVTYRTKGMLSISGKSIISNYGNLTSMPGKRQLPWNGTTSDIADGLTNTVSIMECVGRNHETISGMLGEYFDPPGSIALSPSKRRNSHRWAEPDVADGVSGPSNSTGDKVAFLNNNKQFGGTKECPWVVQNCGPNGEPFSFHNGGVMSLFGDGRVMFVNDDVHFTVLRAILTPNGNEKIGVDR